MDKPDSPIPDFGHLFAAANLAARMQATALREQFAIEDRLTTVLRNMQRSFVNELERLHNMGIAEGQDILVLSPSLKPFFFGYERLTINELGALVNHIAQGMHERISAAMQRPELPVPF